MSLSIGALTTTLPYITYSAQALPINDVKEREIKAPLNIFNIENKNTKRNQKEEMAEVLVNLYNKYNHIFKKGLEINDIKNSNLYFNITKQKSETFVDELSNWYVRRNRSRYWIGGVDEDKISAFMTLYIVLVDLSKLLSPFIPFITEEIYQNLVVNIDKNSPESIHLCKFPICNENLIDKDLEKHMDLAYKIVQLRRSARNNANIKNRQPLYKILVSGENL